MRAAHALMNLATHPRNQVIIAQKGVRLIFEQAIVSSREDATLHMFLVRLIHNISKNTANRTLLYKEELRLKSLQHAKRGVFAEAAMHCGQGKGEGKGEHGAEDEGNGGNGDAARSIGVSSRSKAQTPKNDTRNSSQMKKQQDSPRARVPSAKETTDRVTESFHEWKGRKIPSSEPQKHTRSRQGDSSSLMTKSALRKDDGLSSSLPVHSAKEGSAARRE